MSTTTKRSLYPLHLIIGFGILILFWLLPPIDPITPLGMRCVGAFLSMVYLWSAVETLWPSLVGLFVLALSGYGGDGGFNGVWMNAIGADTVLLTLFAMVLMGGLDAIGDTKYIARWFLTRKLFKGRPVVFLVTYYALCFVLADFHQLHGYFGHQKRRTYLELFLRRHVCRLHAGTAIVPIQGGRADSLCGVPENDGLHGKSNVNSNASIHGSLLRCHGIIHYYLSAAD